MKPIKRIPMDSDTYKRRLVRELNAEALKGNGFYWGAVRCHQAKFSAGRLIVRDILGTWRGIAEGELAKAGEFTDLYGREIVASTQA